MKSALVFVLSLILLLPKPASSQEVRLSSRDRFSVILVGTTAAFCGIWVYRNFVKKPKAPVPQDLKQKALDELKYLGTPAQTQALKKLKSTDEIHNFMAKFWLARDPSPGTELNEAQENFYQRRDYANAHFGTNGWQTDRGRAYILYGPPDQIERVPATTTQFFVTTYHALEFWVYFHPPNTHEPRNIFSNYYPGSAKFVFADFSGTGLFVQIYSSEEGEVSDPRVYETGL